ncbi:hypothetical protein Taro_002886 [Colocasia esculenta]|uniref:Uncharacterized protein n=1 Tax=Colocasia esculenta TaxID=4460 RepID=A0A843TM47_COLES|nr:hypothetical protein [Colocasia esculenta]
MWTLRVAVAVGGIGVDANLRILQVLKDAWRTVERVAVTNRARKRRDVVQFSWELAEGSVCVVFLDTLTPEFELYVRLRERRQWGSDFPEFVLVSLVARSACRVFGLQQRCVRLVPPAVV